MARTGHVVDLAAMRAHLLREVVHDRVRRSRRPEDREHVVKQHALANEKGVSQGLEKSGSGAHRPRKVRVRRHERAGLGERRRRHLENEFYENLHIFP